MNNRKLLLFLSGLILMVLAWFGINYYLSLRALTINFENINSVSVFSAKKLDDTRNEKPVKIINGSGQEIKLKKGSYILQYDAKTNYRDYFVNINLTDKHQVVNLSPEYSDEYLSSLLDGELTSIKTAILTEYPKVKRLYEIQRGRLYKKGDWYGTTLTYKGSFEGANLFRTDTLRVVLEKKDGKWTVRTNPPNILLSKYDYPDIPIDILRNVNGLPTSPAG
ncbi:MAG TPA: hypothetical protein VFW77_02430 [Candidatus Saccharimonadales bacterium]|nr:hypothetical protein [Candidatus Saccharimonadales bacterium]